MWACAALWKLCVSSDSHPDPPNVNTVSRCLPIGDAMAGNVP